MLVLDLEIKNCILQKGEDPIEGMTYCKGWGDHAGMGVSILVVYDYREKRYRTFMDDNQDEFKELIESGRIVVGFNQINFDNKVLKACWDIDIPVEQNYDLLKVIWAAVTKRNGGGKAMHKGYGLNDIAKANLGAQKTTSGANAPIWWQQGKIGAVIDYCINDVKLTKDLLDKVHEYGAIRDPQVEGQNLTIPNVEEFFRGQV